MLPESEPQEPAPSSRLTQEKTATAIYVGLVVFHSLAAHQLVDLIKVNKLNPVLLTDGVQSAHAIPADAHVVILIDLWGQPVPITEYLTGFSAAIPGCKFLALDSAKPGVDVARLLRAGFDGFITHEETMHLLGSAVQAVAEGRVWTSPEITRLYQELTSQRATALSMLTARENQILDLVRRRYSNKEMAVLLQISESTVKFHVSNVLMKLRASHRRELSETEIFPSPSWLSGRPRRKSITAAAPRKVRHQYGA